MKQQIRALKLNLKEIAKEIRNQKKLRKKSHPHHDKYIGDYGVSRLRSEFRHKHVAYCLVRGRNLEQVDSGNKLDMDAINWVIKTMQPESKEKLYIVVNETLTPSQQAVQSAHAAAEFMRKHPHTTWSNGYMILLKDRPSYNGNMQGPWYPTCTEYSTFVEPDLDNKVTAYACFGPEVENRMRNLKLV